MSTPAQTLLLSVVTTLKDEGAVRWTIPELCAYFNEGQHAVREADPTATSVTESVALVAGARQSLPAGGAQLLEVLGNTDGAPVRQTGRRAMDAQLPAWRTMTGAATILQWMFDERDETAFYVYPPAAVGASLDLTYSAYPTPISTAPTTLAAVSDPMGLPDKYANALREYILHRAYAKDAEHPANAQRADRHYAAFAAAVGMGEQATASTAPRRSTASDTQKANP